MQIWFNDEPLACADNLSVSALLTQLEQQQLLALRWRSINTSCRATGGKIISCRKAIGSCFFRLSLEADMLRIADKTFESHLFTGTGKFAAPEVMVEAIRASGSQLVTPAMKRVDLRQRNDAILAPLLAAGLTCCRIPRAPRRRKRRCLPPVWRGKPRVPTG